MCVCVCVCVWLCVCEDMFIRKRLLIIGDQSYIDLSYGSVDTRSYALLLSLLLLSLLLLLLLLVVVVVVVVYLSGIYIKIYLAGI